MSCHEGLEDIDLAEMEKTQKFDTDIKEGHTEMNVMKESSTNVNEECTEMNDTEDFHTDVKREHIEVGGTISSDVNEDKKMDGMKEIYSDVKKDMDETKETNFEVKKENIEMDGPKESNSHVKKEKTVMDWTKGANSELKENNNEIDGSKKNYCDVKEENNEIDGAKEITIGLQKDNTEMDGSKSLNRLSITEPREDLHLNFKQQLVSNDEVEECNSRVAVEPAVEPIPENSSKESDVDQSDFVTMDKSEEEVNTSFVSSENGGLHDEDRSSDDTPKSDTLLTPKPVAAQMLPGPPAGKKPMSERTASPLNGKSPNTGNFATNFVTPGYEESFFQLISGNNRNRRMHKIKKTSYTRNNANGRMHQNISTNFTRFPLSITGTYKRNGKLICINHHEIVKYWCENCRREKCGNCLNVLYSKLCVDHTLMPLDQHIQDTKNLQEEMLQKKSSFCLHSMDQAVNILNQRRQYVELQGIIQGERIRQEFASFHHLLIDEEKRSLQHLEQNIEEYKAANHKMLNACGQITSDEADLMCKTLNHLHTDDPFGTSLQESKKLIEVEWNVLEQNAKEIIVGLPDIPPDVQNTFTLETSKRALLNQMSCRDPIRVVPISYTLFLDVDRLFTPIKVSDLFVCYNKDKIFTEQRFLIKVFRKKTVVQEDKLKMDDYVLNIPGRCYLASNDRYRIQAYLAADVNTRNRTLGSPRNMLIVTGITPIKVRHINCSYINFVRENYRTKCLLARNFTRFSTWSTSSFFDDWKQSKMWRYSSFSECEASYDISPEELRALAYSVDQGTYKTLCTDIDMDFYQMCRHGQESHSLSYHQMTIISQT